MIQNPFIGLGNLDPNGIQIQQQSTIQIQQENIFINIFSKKKCKNFCIALRYDK